MDFLNDSMGLKVGRRITVQVAAVSICAGIFAFIAKLAFQYAGFKNASVLAIVSAIVNLEVFVSLSELMLQGFTCNYVPKVKDYDESGLPDSSKVVIAVPVQLHSMAQIEAVVETAAWNVRMANDSNVFLVILSDFPDRFRDSQDPDEYVLFEELSKRVDEINHGLGSRYGKSIHIIHRPLVWIDSENCWMGRERKRGKIRLINDLILSRGCHDLEVSSDLMDRLIQVKYVLCLDEDNKLTPNTVQRLAGLLDHPSNSPDIDGKGVASGNGIAVCQLITEQSSASRWRFPRALAGATISPHRQPYPVGNFLCDWLGQAKYNGKGMYDPRVYDVVCRALPDEVILSHDTVEGAYLRAGFVPHAAITEHIPSSHQSILARTERWIRGDVQNIALVLAGFIGRDFSKKLPKMSLVGIYFILYQAIPLASVLLAFPLAATLILRSSRFSPVFVFLIFAIGSYFRVLENISRDARRLTWTQALDIYPAYLGRIHIAIMHRLIIAPGVFFAAFGGAFLACWRLMRGKRLLKWRSMALVDANQGSSGLLIWPSFVFCFGILVFGMQRGLSPLNLVVISMWCLLPLADKIFLAKE
ncbi:hypothetical protein ACKAWT_06065 [Xanthomonas vasicola]|uniref:glycosyltransferase 36 n=3 Tax=Xanthomonas vasicola TaxID=56459 RepID=UPI0001CBF275|nr:glycosyltransferase 36 [Xanthomonas vasicola]MBV6745583.1 hypothetical protein [Xanthomonas vasicola pv. vasculorum NCPPB 890]MDO6970358.1 hypothetical protein [Xanthomonas vasicola]MDO6971804.1 hypothetical protein [Xanthomonas vasicola]HHZ22063.1 hypothetical protein [Xanthomonas vasicola pv. zeae]HHZ33138.1 hypothetical protein [Xanthomonas vasicola pv. zeae]